MNDLSTSDPTTSDPTTSDLAASEKIQQLDQRHTQLIDELDTLNERLELVLNSFAKANADEVPNNA